ncbi:MAG: valine--pyruvate transaminase [Spirochaetales bacterium]|nr:MAG: valine--pyruvate transaminase [Spirochaetales bacterium]
MTDTQFARRFSRKSGILELMDDMGLAMAGDRSVHMLGGGNPAHIPEMNELWRKRIQEILSNGQELDEILANYSTPRGKIDFLHSVAGLLNREFGWNLTEKNIAVTNSSQTAFFYLFNLFSGKTAGKDSRAVKKILFPLCPEYIGYANQTIEEEALVSWPAEIELTRENFFKYRVDFSNLEISSDIGALCVSRPTNPTGNVLTDEEIAGLSALAEEKNIPFIIDNAYGMPFPNMIFTENKPLWNKNIILSMSLSKLGLPSVRTGIVVAREEIIEALTACSAIISLSTGNIGQAIVQPLMDSGEILRISRSIVRPFYFQRSRQAIESIQKAVGGRFPYRIHECEGSLFLWLWLPELPVSSTVLYERLKKRGVLVINGKYFFFGLEKEWKHSQQCLRISYALSPEEFREAMNIMAEEICLILDGK